MEAVVHKGAKEPAVYRRFDYLTRIDITAAFELPPRAPWDGLVLGTVTSKQEFEALQKLARAWEPLVMLVAYPSTISGRDLKHWRPRLGDKYFATVIKASHHHWGGVT